MKPQWLQPHDREKWLPSCMHQMCHAWCACCVIVHIGSDVKQAEWWGCMSCCHVVCVVLRGAEGVGITVVRSCLHKHGRWPPAAQQDCFDVPHHNSTMLWVALCSPACVLNVDWCVVAGEDVTVDMEKNVLINHTTGKEYALKPLGDVSAKITAMRWLCTLS